MTTKLVKLETADVADIQKQLRDLADLLPELDEMEACGIDCSGARVVRDRLFEELTQLVDKFSDFRPGAASAARP